MRAPKVSEMFEWGKNLPIGNVCAEKMMWVALTAVTEGLMYTRWVRVDKQYPHRQI